MKPGPAPDPNAPDEPVLWAWGLVKQFAGRRVVDGVNLCCGAGQVLGLLGANGAGKTTTLRLCAGFLQPDATWRASTAAPTPRQPPVRWGFAPRTTPSTAISPCAATWSR